MITEVLFNRLPIVLSHGLFAPLFGINYVLISWWWLHRTGIVYYPFLDPTLPPAQAIVAHTALFAILMAFFCLRVGASRLASYAPLIVRASVLYSMALSITSWPRFIRGWPRALPRPEQDASVGRGGE